MAELAKAMDRASVGRSKREGKYLAFALDNEEYGLGILKIKEIIGMMPITPVPQTPDFVKGVINLRGKVIPIVDLRSRFGMEEIDYDERTCIVIVETAKESVNVMIGMVVDSVSEVLKIKGEAIEDAPPFGVKLNTEYILGMAKMEGDVKILLDIDRVLSVAEIGANEKIKGSVEKEQSPPKDSRYGICQQTAWKQA